MKNKQLQRIKLVLGTILCLAGLAWVPAQSQDTPASVADSSWRGADLFGNKADYYFGSDGTLIVRDGRGVIPIPASWRQNGDTVEIEFNGGFVELTGKLNGPQLAGTGRTKPGRTGQWALTRESQNFESLAQLYASRKAPAPVGTPNAAALNGRYVGIVAGRDADHTFVLACSSDQSCSLIPPRPSAGPAPAPVPPATPRALETARMAAYQNALNFARNNRFETTNVNIPPYKTLAPILQGDTTLERCYELEQRGPEPAVVCATRFSADSRPVWIHFVSLMYCSRDFCAYLPIPLYPAKD